MPEETVLLKFHVGSKCVILSRLDMDFRGYDGQGMNGANVVWNAPAGADLIGLPKHEFVIRNDDGVINVIRRERTK